MRQLGFSEAINDALGQAMVADPRIIIIGEDVQGMRSGLFVRFGRQRVRNTPVSEAAFVGAAVTAAMAGLRPVVELWMADFLTVAMDAIVNHAAKLNTFSGDRWNTPFIIRAPCGGGYGDGGQHEQSLWGWLAHIPGLAVMVPSTPAEAGGLMMAALNHNGPVIFLESKMLSTFLLDAITASKRRPVDFVSPPDGIFGQVPKHWVPLPIGEAAIKRPGSDITIVSVGLGVHRALEAASKLEDEGISASVLDLRTVAPLDKKTVCDDVARTGRLLVVDEDYEGFGLSGELAAVVLEAGIEFKFARVCTQTTIPFARKREDETLPNVKRIMEAVLQILEQ